MPRQSSSLELTDNVGTNFVHRRFIIVAKITNFLTSYNSLYQKEIEQLKVSFAAFVKPYPLVLVQCPEFCNVSHVLQMLNVRLCFWNSQKDAEIS